MITHVDSAKFSLAMSVLFKTIYSRFPANKYMFNAGGGERCRAVLTEFFGVSS